MSGNEVGGGAIPAPPGVSANLVNPPDHTRDFIILHTICVALVTTAVGVRFFTRALITRKVGLDDCEVFNQKDIWWCPCTDESRYGVICLGLWKPHWYPSLQPLIR